MWAYKQPLLLLHVNSADIAPPVTAADTGNPQLPPQPHPRRSAHVPCPRPPQFFIPTSKSCYKDLNPPQGMFTVALHLQGVLRSPSFLLKQYSVPSILVPPHRVHVTPLETQGEGAVTYGRKVGSWLLSLFSPGSLRHARAAGCSATWAHSDKSAT